MGKSDSVAGFSGETLKELLEREKLNNATLAKKLGIPRIPTISEWRNGVCVPDKENITKLAEFFNVSEAILKRSL